MAGLHTRVCTISDALIMRCLPASWRQFSPQVVLLAVSVGIYLPLCCSYAPLFTSEDCGQFVHYIVTDDSDIPRFFFTSCWGATVQPEGFYRPLMQLHFHLLYRWFGLAAFPLHFSCLLLFLLVIQAAYAFAFGLFCQRHAAVLSALLVIMHPATSHNIFFSHNSGDLLLALFFMLTLLCCQQNRHPLLTAGMMLCAFASKETGYVLPPLILLYEIIIRELSLRESIRKHRVMIFLTAAFACFRLVLFNGVGGYGASVHRIDFAIAGKLLFKIKLCAASFHPMFAAIVALLLVLMLLRGLRCRTAMPRRLLFLGSALLLSILPMASLFISERHAINDLLLPLVLFSVGAGALLQVLRRCLRPAGAFYLLLFVILLPIAARAWTESSFWYSMALPRNQLFARLSAQLSRCPTASALLVIAWRPRLHSDPAFDQLHHSVKVALWHDPAAAWRPVYYSWYDRLRHSAANDSFTVYYADKQQQVSPWSTRQLLANYRATPDHQIFQHFLAADTCAITLQQLQNLVKCQNPLIYTALLDTVAHAAGSGRKRLYGEYLLTMYTDGESLSLPWWEQALCAPSLAAETDSLFTNILENAFLHHPRQLDSGALCRILQQPALSAPAIAFLAAHLYRQGAIDRREFIRLLPPLDSCRSDIERVIALLIRLDRNHPGLFRDAMRARYAIHRPGDLLTLLHYFCRNAWNRPELPCVIERLLLDPQTAHGFRH